MNKASGDDGISANLFKTIKDYVVKSAALSLPTNLENSAMGTELEKVSFHSTLKEGQCQRMFELPFHMLAR